MMVELKLHPNKKYFTNCVYGYLKNKTAYTLLLLPKLRQREHIQKTDTFHKISQA